MATIQANMPSVVKQRISGPLFCFFWFFSIVSGFFILICPSFLLAIFAPKLYRRWSDIVFGMWEPYPVAMMEIFLNVRVIMSGDSIDPREGSVVIMNHRTRLDWNFLWAAFYHSAHPHNHSLKFILKAPIMHIPGPGWVMQACSFLFIHRNWAKDQKLLANSLNYLKITERSCQILIFPEGTDLTAKSLDRSHRYAEKNGLDRYFKVLHPKTTGFVFIVNQMRQNNQLEAVYDLTVGYPKVIAETELDLFRGIFPREIHFHVQRHDNKSIPTKEEELQQWINSVWKGKENILHRFYNNGSFTNHDFTPDCLEQNNTNELLKNRAKIDNSDNHDNCFPHSGAALQANRKNYIPNDKEMILKNGMKNCKLIEMAGNYLYLSLIFWTCLVLSFFYLLINNFYFQMWVLFHFLVFFILSFISNGFHQLLARYNQRNVDKNTNYKYK